MKKSSAPAPADAFPPEDFRATSAAFSQLAGVLGGFCFTVLVLILSQDFLKDSPEVKDWVLGLLLLAAFIYVLSSSYLANATNSMQYKTAAARRQIFQLGIVLSSIAHLLLASTLTLLVYQFNSTLGMMSAGLILVLTVINLFGTSILEYRMSRVKR